MPKEREGKRITLRQIRLLRAARQLAGFTQQELAELAKLDVSEIVELERGQKIPSARKMWAIYRTFRAARIRFVDGGVIREDWIEQ